MLLSKELYTRRGRKIYFLISGTAGVHWIPRLGTLAMTQLTRSQRIVLILYCLAVAYCCLWVPWIYNLPGDGIKNVQGGYALIWDGPPSGFGVPNLIAIIVRIMAVTALSAAAFVLTGMRISWRNLVGGSQIKKPLTTP